MPNIRPLIPSLQKIAIEELNEVPERLDADLKALREWIEKEQYIRARTSDQFLVAFLRGCKFSLEKTKQKIEKHYTLKAGIPEVFQDRNLSNPKVLEILRLGVALRLQTPLEEDGPCISIIRAGAYDTSKYSFPEIIKVGTMIGDIQLLEDDNSVISGLVEIMDLANVTAGHLFQLNPIFLKKCSVFADEAMPMRQKGTHFINTPPGFETLFNSIKAVFGEKATKRIFVHGSNMESLYEHIPRKYLPVEYGGENGTIQGIIDNWEKKLTSYNDYFLEDDQYGTDEKLRGDGEPVNFDNVFGINGSFRKLNVD